MKGDMVEKIKMEADGEEYNGLVSMDEYVIEDDKVDVPGPDKIVGVRTGVKKVPEVGSIFKVKRDSQERKKLQNWYYNKEYKDVVIIRTDGAGNEVSRELWPNTEVRKCHGPAYDASSPVYAQVIVTFLPEDIIPIDGES